MEERAETGNAIERPPIRRQRTREKWEFESQGIPLVSCSVSIRERAKRQRLTVNQNKYQDNSNQSLYNYSYISVLKFLLFPLFLFRSHRQSFPSFIRSRSFLSFSPAKFDSVLKLFTAPKGIFARGRTNLQPFFPLSLVISLFLSLLFSFTFSLLLHSMLLRALEIQFLARKL